MSNPVTFINVVDVDPAKQQEALTTPSADARLRVMGAMNRRFGRSSFPQLLVQRASTQ